MLYHLKARRAGAMLLACLVAVFVFSGCPYSGDTSGLIFGTWRSASDHYEITPQSLVYYFDAMEGFSAADWHGTIADNTRFDDKTGVLIVKVTRATGVDLHEDFFTGVYYKNLVAWTVHMASAVDSTKDDYPPVQFETLDDARAAFTEGRADTYVSFWGDYSK